MLEMPVECPLPLSPNFDNNAEAYVESLLSFITSSELFQTLCGGVHILDFLTKEPDLYSTILPEEWRIWFQIHDIPAILDLLMKEDDNLLESLKSSMDSLSAENHGKSTWRNGLCPPTSLLEYILAIRRHALNRDFRSPDASAGTGPLPRHVSVGMKPKKIHEVENFVRSINGLTTDIDTVDRHKITHIVDFGSGQNYLGRALASPPYNKQVIALESKQINIKGAKNMDITARLAEKDKIMRNKKEYRMSSQGPNHEPNASQPENVHSNSSSQAPINGNTHGSIDQANADESRGRIQYIESFIQNGDLSKVVHEIKCAPNTPGIIGSDPQLMVISLHSCGNLLHHGLRSLILNPSVKVVAMVGCCYNLVTERLGPPTYKLPSLRSPNVRLDATSSACDPHGFPMSERLTTYRHQHDQGIRLNITARMMAVQAPENWTATECESFFTRHFYRALLQRILLDRGIVDKPSQDGGGDGGSPRGWTGAGPALTIGSLRKACYSSFTAYVRGAIAKLADDQERGTEIQRRMKGLNDEDISGYEDNFKKKKKELSVVWSLMAFSASVVESSIVVDRWLYLKEQAEVKNCWVETVFDYKQSPRNLVVVGIKR